MITNSAIAFGDQLGAQMTSLANLIFLSEKNDQEIVFWEELRNFRRGYQFLDVFECSGIRFINSKNSIIKRIAKNISRINYCNWERNMKKAYFSKFKYYKDRIMYEIIRQSYRDFNQIKGNNNGVHCIESLLQLEKTSNYDIVDGFGTYQDWKESTERIKKEYTFKNSIINEGNRIISEMDFKGLVPVCVHFRLADYLVLSSLNLSIDYYETAFKFFDDSKSIYLVFSDEIDKVKNLDLFNNKNVIFMEKNNSAAVDMYIMTKCYGGAIIANSSFSFWGSFLNKSNNKTVVCPKCFVSEQSYANYLNGNYYPNEWISI